MSEMELREALTRHGRLNFLLHAECTTGCELTDDGCQCGRLTVRRLLAIPAEPEQADAVAGLDVEGWDQRTAFSAAERALAVPHRDDDQPCGCDDCMGYGAEDAGADWFRIPTPNRIVIRALDSGDERLAPLAKAVADHAAEYARLALAPAEPEQADEVAGLSVSDVFRMSGYRCPLCGEPHIPPLAHSSADLEAWRLFARLAPARDDTSGGPS